MFSGEWSGLLATAIAIATLIFARLTLAADHKRRATTGIAFLAGALVARGFRILAESLHNVGVAEVISFIDDALLGLGLTWMFDILIFDLTLARVRIHTPRILRDMLQAVAFILVVFALLRTHGVDVMPLLTTSAVLTAVIGFALQGTIANLFAGLSMQLDRSFAIGDWIQIGARMGKIEQIKWRSTSIVTNDGDVLVIPNAQLTTHEVLNYSGPSKPHRMRAEICFHYRHPPNEVKGIVLEALHGTPGVLDLPKASCIPTVFGDFGVHYLVLYWIDDMSRDLSIDGEVKTRLWYAAKRAGLEIPYPIQTVMVDQVPAPKQKSAQDSEIEDRLNLVHSIEVLAPLDDADRLILTERLRRMRFAAGERIIRQGDPGDSLFLIAMGQVNVKFQHEGVEREVATLGPRDFFGEMSLLTGEPRTATCEAKTDVVAFVIDHVAFRLLLEAKPKLVEDISKVLGRRMSALTAEEALISADAARRVVESSNKLMKRIRDFFNLRST